MNTSGKLKGVSLVLLAATILVAAPAALGQGKAGTTLSVEKTATGHWTKTYGWTISKSASPDTRTIWENEEGTIHYTIKATKFLQEQEAAFVSGTITVWNGPDGDRPTENLKIVDQVEYKTGSESFQPLPGATQTIIPSQQLAPDERRTYDYHIPFTPIPGATYRNTVKVTITNHSGHLGEEFGPEPKADFSMPDAPIPMNDQVKVTDETSFPGLTQVGTTGEPAWPQRIDDSRTFTFSKTFTSNSAGTYPVENIATLSALSGLVLDEARATATIDVIDIDSSGPAITGVKFYDTNLNGVWDEDEPPLEGWKVRLQGPGVDSYAFTNSNGRYSFSNLAPGTYTVSEIFPYCPQWVPTTETSYECELGPEETFVGPDFGNVCVQPASDGRTIRFWSSEKGQLLMTPEDLEPLGFDTAADLAEYLRTASLKEFAHMLVAQWIVARLNLDHEFLYEKTIVYLGPLGFKSIDELVTEALLAMDESTPQKQQECHARLLEGLNADRWPFLSLDPCPVLYAD
jgi:hypothetical protein